MVVGYLKILTSNVGGKVLAIAILPIVAKKLGPAGFGTLSVYMAIGGFATAIIMMRFNEFVLVDYYKSEKKEFSNTIKNGALIALATFLLLITLSVIMKSSLEEWLGLGFGWVILAFGYAFAQWFYQIALNLARLHEKFSLYAAIDFLNHVGLALGTLVFVVNFDSGWQGRVYSQYIISMLAIALFVYLFVKLLKLDLTYFRLRTVEILGFCLPLLPHSLIPFVRLGLDKLLLVGIIAREDLGIYSLAMTLAIGFNMIINSFITIIQPNLYANFEKNGGAFFDMKLIIKILGIVGVFLMIGGLVLRFFVEIYLGQEYFDALRYIPWILVDIWMFMVFRILNIPLFYTGKVKAFGASLGFSILFQGLVMIIMAKYLGIDGVLFALIAADSLRALLSYLTGSRVLKLHVKW